ncbi:hypothetical protein [Roseibium limicola]|uniref:Uncharacterized protein n=1 Tax=Roseibium limicola TaxID=2816037 RepID=A0A939J610_9HYPH|nr:hypothetical protein [Roseibium limicola]MBO0344632.1 hypothetical protein [Roseibium limicola]
MSMPPHFPASAYQHEHSQPAADPARLLLEQVEENNLREMWDMVLMLDYEVANVYELDRETQEEFCSIITLLLKAFTK